MRQRRPSWARGDDLNDHEREELERWREARDEAEGDDNRPWNDGLDRPVRSRPQGDKE